MPTLIESPQSVLDPFDRTNLGPDERSYIAEVDRLFENGVDAWVSNGKPIHAAYLISKFLNEAERTVRLFTGSLVRVKGAVSMYGSSGIVDAAKNFLSRQGAVLTIVTEQNLDVDRENDETEKDHPLIRGIKSSSDIKGQIYLYQYKHDKHVLPANIHHFMVMDDHALRFEKNHASTQAYVNFNNRKLAGICCDVFDTYLVPHSRVINL